MKEDTSETRNQPKTTAELSHSSHEIEEKLEERPLTSSQMLKIYKHDINLDHTTQKANNKTAESADLESASKPWSIQVEETANANIISWDSSSDSDNPLNWPTWRKWTLITLVSFITFMAGLSSSMFAPSVPALMTEFHSTNSILGSFVVTVFVLGFATGPLLFAPLSELYGRLLVQHIGSIGFLIFSIACALSKNLSTLIGMRLLQGIFAAAPLTNGGAIIADMVKQEERGFAMAMFTLGMLLGSVVGPVCGGFLAANKGWRWVFWVISIFVAVTAILGIIFWKESYAPVLLARKASRLRSETGNQNLRAKYDTGLSPRNHFKRAISRTIKMLVFSPIVLSLSIFQGLMYSYFYLLFTTLTPIFENNYQFSPQIVGLSYLGIGTGFLIGQMTFARLGDRILKMMAKRWGSGEMKPEYRLPLCCFGGLFTPVGLFWYGWSVQAHVHWIMPMIGTALIGMGNSLLFISIQAYTVDAFTLYAASALAANTITRSVMAATLPLAAPKMYQTLGLGWGNSLLAFLALAMVPVPVLLMVHGEKMRMWNVERMKRL